MFIGEPCPINKTGIFIMTSSSEKTHNPFLEAVRKWFFMTVNMDSRFRGNDKPGKTDSSFA
jgi:hypothetical protein